MWLQSWKKYWKAVNIWQSHRWMLRDPILLSNTVESRRLTAMSVNSTRFSSRLVLYLDSFPVTLNYGNFSTIYMETNRMSITTARVSYLLVWMTNFLIKNQLPFHVFAMPEDNPSTSFASTPHQCFQFRHERKQKSAALSAFSIQVPCGGCRQVGEEKAMCCQIQLHQLLAMERRNRLAIHQQMQSVGHLTERPACGNLGNGAKDRHSCSSWVHPESCRHIQLAKYDYLLFVLLARLESIQPARNRFHHQEYLVRGSQIETEELISGSGIATGRRRGDWNRKNRSRRCLASFHQDRPCGWGVWLRSGQNGQGLVQQKLSPAKRSEKNKPQ